MQGTLPNDHGHRNQASRRLRPDMKEVQSGRSGSEGGIGYLPTKELLAGSLHINSCLDFQVGFSAASKIRDTWARSIGAPHACGPDYILVPRYRLGQYDL